MIDCCRDYLTEYIANGFALLPLANHDGKVFPNVPRGAHVLNDAGDGLNTQWALATYDQYMQYVMEHGNITMMGIYPKFAGFLVLDLDNSPAHANTTNGIQNFINLCKGMKLSPKMASYLADFPNNFPCWVETPHHGIHLYFKADFVPSNWAKDTSTNQLNIEVKYNCQVTAAGSIRDGVMYTMHGYLEDAPQITLDLLDAFTKAPPKPKFVPRKSFAPKEPTEQWNATPDGIVEKARQLHGANAHETIMWMAKYFAMAGFSFDDALAAIEATPEHQNRKDKADTKTCVKSFFR